MGSLLREGIVGPLKYHFPSTSTISQKSILCAFRIMIIESDHALRSVSCFQHVCLLLSQHTVEWTVLSGQLYLPLLLSY